MADINSLNLSDWESVVARIDQMLGDERYSFAADTLEGIRKTISIRQSYTAPQIMAIDNIQEGGDRRAEGERDRHAGRRGGGRRYEGFSGRRY